jgi:hypothetical protein
MIEGKCPKCGTAYFGWALHSPRNQYCNDCGTSLEIIEDGETFRGYSPFEAEKYNIKDSSGFLDLSAKLRKPEQN